MKQKILTVIVAILMVCFILSPLQVTATSSDEVEYTLGSDFTSSQFSPRFGETTILLKRGFDFINTGSASVNWELALTGVTLSDRVYNGTSAEDVLKDLGYDKTKTTEPLGSDSNIAFHPVSSLGYKRLSDGSGNGKNVFAIVVRGTSNLSADWITDLYDGANSMFDTSRGNVAGDLKKFIQDATGKSIDSLKSEDNYFFITGHSLGGAVANALSVDETVTSLCNGNKENIYTYTFESPHTCVNLWWMGVEGMSNAFNIKDIDDAITNVAPYIGATTYGKDLTFSVNDFDNSIFVKVFPNANGISVTNAPHPQNYGDVFGHHDLGLCLVYIMQHGISDGWWDHVHKIDDYISMWTKEEVMIKKSSIDWSSAYYHSIVDNNYQLHIDDQWNTVITITSNTRMALYDFDKNSIPELLIGNIVAHGMGLIVFSVVGNEVVYIGGCGAGSYSYSNDNAYPGLFVDYNGSYPYEYSPVGYLSIIDNKLNSSPIITYGEYDQQTKSRTTTVNDDGLYRTYNGDKINLDFNLWSDIQANGWESFLRFYGYLGDQEQSDQGNQYERFDLTLGDTKFSIELPSNWHAKPPLHTPEKI